MGGRTSGDGAGDYETADIVIPHNLRSAQRAVNPAETADHAAANRCSDSKCHARASHLLLALQNSAEVEEIPDLGLDVDLFG